MYFKMQFIHVMQNWIFSIITPVFSVTWSFGNHYNMLIWCSRNLYYYYYYYYQCKNSSGAIFDYIFVETVIKKNLEIFNEQKIQKNSIHLK